MTKAAPRHIPFFPDKRPASCKGPACVRMAICAFLRERGERPITTKALYRLMNYKKGQWFCEQYIVKALWRNKIPAKYFSTAPLEKIGNSLKNLEKVIGPIGKISPKALAELINVREYDSAAEFLKKRGLYAKKRLTEKYLIKSLDEKKRVIALVNRNALSGKNVGYKGHFTLIYGHDSRGFIASDPYFGRRIRISFARFRKAFYYPGPTKKDRPSRDAIVIG